MCDSPVNGDNCSGQSSRASSQPREPPVPPQGAPPPLPPGAPPPPLPPHHSPPPPPSDGQDDVAAKLAASAAQQLELQKKLLEGSEAVTLSQQEDMQIKGQSARHLVMQVLVLITFMEYHVQLWYQTGRTFSRS